MVHILFMSEAQVREKLSVTLWEHEGQEKRECPTASTVTKHVTAVSDAIFGEMERLQPLSEAEIDVYLRHLGVAREVLTRKDPGHSPIFRGRISFQGQFLKDIYAQLVESLKVYKPEDNDFYYFDRNHGGPVVRYPPEAISTHQLEKLDKTRGLTFPQLEKAVLGLCIFWPKTPLQPP